MPTYIGENKIVDRYLGDKFLEAAYIGDQKVYDPYTEITGYLPVIFKSRAAVALKNYRIYGTSAGAGVETENLWDGKISSLTIRQVTSTGDIRSAFVISKPGVYTAKCFENCSGYVYCKKYTISTDTYETAKWLSVPSGNPNPVVTVTSMVDSDNIFIVYNPLSGNLSEAANIFNSSKLCVIESSTAPTTYIPYGYKIPILCQSDSDNLWNGNAVEWGNDSALVITKNQDNSYSIAKSIIGASSYPSVKVGANLETGKKYKLSFKIEGLTQEMISTQPFAAMRNTITNATLTSTRTYFTGDGAYYVPIEEAPDNNYAFSIELVFNNAAITFSNVVISDIVIEEVQQSNYDLYIGSSKLSEEEYVDFGEQKIYKNMRLSGGILNNVFIASTGVISSYEGFSVIYVPITIGKEYILKRKDGVFSEYNTAFYNSIPSIYSVSYDNNRYKFSTENIIVAPITGYIAVTVSTAFAENLCVLQPTDPPVSLPPIPTYKGENTLSSTETLGEVTVKGRIRELNYKRLSYIKTSDGSAYIDTDITGLNAATDYIEAEMSLGALNYIEDGVVLFGCATLNEGHWNLFGASCNGYEQDATVRINHFYSYVNYSTGGSGTIKRMRVVTNSDFSSKLLFSVKTPQSTITNLETGTVYTPSVFDPNWDAASLQPIDFVQTASFTVFAGQYYRSAGDVVYYKSHRNASCYGARIYRNDVLIHNLVPVEREDGELGLLDTITNKFYTNAGTGTFEKGEYI